MAETIAAVYEEGCMRAGSGSDAAAASSGSSVVTRYEALIRVSEGLRGYHDRGALFRSLARELRPVVPFSFLGLALYDERTRAVEPFVLAATGEPMAPPVLSDDEQLTYWVLEHQTPLLIPNVADERRFPQEMAYLRRQGIVSTCSLPLITSRRRVGMLITGSREPHVYGEEDVTFFSLVANQVALAVDHAESYGALAAALTAERERQQALDASDELLRAVAAVLDVRQVFPRVSDIARQVLPHDRLTFTFYDGHREVRVQADSNPEFPLPDRVILPHPVPEEATFALITDLRTMTLPRIEPFGLWQQIKDAGYRSLMGVRVKARDQILALQFWSKQPHAFDEQHVAVARRIVDHVALAVSHEQLAQLAREAAEATLRAERLEARVRLLTEQLTAKTGRMIGPSAEWQAVLKAATQVASTDTTVLLTGESGTGKEVIARFIHHGSGRASGPFVALNCAALPEQLLESELFGFERGAFTGAQQPKPGQIELAAGGVLFLDEVAEMSPSAQAKFLRVLQEREFQRLGSTRTLKANVRVIAATNRDLKKAMERGDFREDLYYRLQVFDIRLPPLRERRADILPMSDAFLHEIGQLFGRPPAGLTRAAKELLQQYHWPGNVRQLRNALERAAILCEGGLITPEHLSLDGQPSVATTLTSASGGDAPGLNDVERDMIRQALAACSGNKSKAAERLGITRTQLYVRLRKYRLS
jgi:formate hydrogenlyase transcriptional activator